LTESAPSSLPPYRHTRQRPIMHSAVTSSEYGYSVCSDGPIPVIRWRPGCAA
jgi:hypothetical protein